MKKLFLIFLLGHILIPSARAQYCGSPGVFGCPITDTIPNPGYYPPPDSFPSFINNLQTKTTLSFLNFDSILFGNEVLHVYGLGFDSINNLPPGLCWQTNEPYDTYSTSQTGCIQFSGTPCGPTGQYKLVTIITLDIGSPVTTDGDGGGFKYFVRLKNYDNPDTPVDTNQTDSTPVLYYGDTCHPELPLTINLGSDSAFCTGSIINFNPEVSGGLPPYTYAWQSPTSFLSCLNCANPVATLNQNSSFTLIVTDANSQSVSQTVNYSAIGAFGNFTIIALGALYYCDTGTVTLHSNTGLSTSYQWFRNDSIINGANQSSFTVSDSTGTYILQYDESGVCLATSNAIQISFFPSPTVSISSLGSPYLCLGSMVILQADKLPNLIYQWQLNNNDIPDSTAAYYFATDPGNYRLVVTSPQYCPDTSNVITVTTNPNPPPSISFAQYVGDTMCNNAATFQLSGGNPVGGSYSGNGVFNNYFYPDSAIFGSNYITYTYTDSDGCSNWALDSITVELCTGIEGAGDNLAAVLFPDPANDWLTIQCAQFSMHIVTIELYDMMGNRISLKNNGISYWQSGKYLLNVARLSPGLYFLSVNSGTQKFVKRFMKVD